MFVQLTPSTLVAALAACTLASWAGTWAPGISVDGSVDDWDGQVPFVAIDVPGDGGTGRDCQALYLANDGQNLYVRIQSYNSVAYNGNEFTGIDGDTTSTTGFNLFGVGIGSDTLIAGASAFGETTTQFNSGAATPGSILFSPWTPSTDIELAIPLNMTIPGDISQSFPGGLGSTIAVVYGDGNSGAWDTLGPVTYTLENDPGTLPKTQVIDDFDVVGGDPTKRTKEDSSGGQVNSRGWDTGKNGGSGDYSLTVQLQNPNTAWQLAAVSRRLATGRNISGTSGVTCDVYGDPAAAGEKIWMELGDADGTRMATTDQDVPATAAWTTVNFGDPTTWYLQAAGSVPGLNLSQIVYWRLGVSNASGNAGVYNLKFDNLMALPAASVNEWSLY
ncbi:MAG: hypothetical protein D6691_11515 [Candidatus Hydrogenedentota bacterium]|uniref:Uncharacterized protein n=1 Tax=Sumerlaea chitinivorans TaxID=2250252 RepID=A0A2Z4Y7W0_SUMC1|nr:hypothetical protein BRCON_2592 [Candidatus Sumerlaea chitinivorans]RMH24549.1 MAG: hypothetical protein D6691_11515 [Candidatus Hydrogenedentota bacterium]GIX43791.1 MAG: hypothetical protein KatS3mg130_0199 [Candidatus Sumerlaea sp.]